MLRKMGLLVLTVLAVLGIPVVLFLLAAVLNGPYQWWQASRLFQAHRPQFEATVRDVIEKGILQIDLSDDDTLSIMCDDQRMACISPTADTQFIFRNLGFVYVKREGTDVYFAKDRGYDYHMGVVKFSKPPAQLKGRKFEYRKLDGEWYLYSQP